MKTFLLGGFIFLSSAVFSQLNVQVFVSYTNSYCGGARPTEQILTKYNTPAKLANFKIKLAGKKSYLLTTDSAGFFTHKIKPGKYSVYLTEEKNQNLFINYDPSCPKMLKTAFAELIIEKAKKQYSVNLYFPCNPCVPNTKP